MEYTIDELADDSEDEKRLEKAEHLAEKKGMKHKKHAEPPSSKQSARFVPASAAVMAGSPGYQGPPGYQVPPRQSAVPLSQSFKVPGPCFTCGEVGHIRSRCPKSASGAVLDSRKWYPFQHGLCDTLRGGTCVKRDSLEQC